jgi:hypothetical protein
MGTVHKCVNDLGAAAYVMMYKYRVAGKKGKSIYFKVPESEVAEFDALIMEYLDSEFHRFDSCLMSLKKIGEYMPPVE